MSDEQNGERGASRRTLVVANEAVSGEQLLRDLREQLGDPPGKVLVVAPALVDSALKHTMGDVDAAIPEARKRLERSLSELREHGIAAAGEVGDSDPTVAVSDEMQKFDPDQIVVVAHEGADAAFAEKNLLEQLGRDVSRPITELVVDHTQPDPHVVDVKRQESRAIRERGWRISANWPPLTRRDIAGILIAAIGTLALALIAAISMAGGSGPSGLENGDIGGVSAARVLIAIGMALINLAHVVGIFLFKSSGYEGIWTRFFARLSLIGTPVAVAISLLLGLI